MEMQPRWQGRMHFPRVDDATRVGDLRPWRRDGPIEHERRHIGSEDGRRLEEEDVDRRVQGPPLVFPQMV